MLSLQLPSLFSPSHRSNTLRKTVSSFLSGLPPWNSTLFEPCSSAQEVVKFFMPPIFLHCFQYSSMLLHCWNLRFVGEIYLSFLNLILFGFLVFLWILGTKNTHFEAIFQHFHMRSCIFSHPWHWCKDADFHQIRSDQDPPCILILSPSDAILTVSWCYYCHISHQFAKERFKWFFSCWCPWNQ